MSRTRGLFLVLFIFSLLQSFAQQGKDGAKIISSTGTVVNEYTSLTANATAGSTLLTVSNSALNMHNRFAAPLGQGDLVMIIQMQGASINGTATDSTWGAVTNYNNCGLYEFSDVTGAPNGTTINLSCPLKNSYTATGKVQVVRVPRFSSLTINSGGVLTADAWNGTQGGIVIAEVQGNTVINVGGAINATGLGFRGGVYVNNTAGPAYTYIYNSTDITLGGEQGEGIAGFETDYIAYNGRYCMGAPANGGGGGNSWNCPGGGGANAGSISGWTGNGNPDTSNTNWIQAWNLEYNGFAFSTSSGGGRGGYGVAYSGNPLTMGPNSSSWDQYLRASTGGKGGRPLDYSTGRVFFGGGGGAPKADNNNGSSGANGGGMVYILCYGTVSGGGTIAANGNTAPNANCGVNYGDPPGGGGGGGTVMVYCTGAISNISISANGGNGGNQLINNPGNESEGAGGGGGGGYIAVSNGNITRQALGGANGTTNSIPMINFPPDGATRGGAGLANEIINGIPVSFGTGGTSTGVSICGGDTTSLSVSGGTTYLWSPDTGLSCTNCPNPIANPSHTTTYVVQVSNGGSCSSSDTVTVTVLPAAQTGTITSIPDTICAGNSVQLSVTGNTGNIQWQSSLNGIAFTDIAGADSSNYTSVLLLQTTDYRLVASNNMCSDTSTPFTVLVNPNPAPPVLNVNDSIFCPQDSALISASGSYSTYRWNNGDTLSYTYVFAAGGYWLTVTNAAGCSAVSGHQQILVYPAASVSIIVQGDTLSSFGAVSYQWLLNDTVIPNADKNLFIAKQSGNYAVQITDTNGCISTSDNVPVFIAGIRSLDLGAGIQLYPNPASSQVYISVLDGTPVSEIGIFNTLGQEIKSVAVPFNSRSKFEIDISELGTGMYECMFFSGNQLVYCKKLIK